jgi:hypothetical protein
MRRTGVICCNWSRGTSDEGDATNVGLMASLLVVLFGLVFLAGCVLGGVWDLTLCVRRSGASRQIAARGAVKLIAAALVGTIPWIAVPIAESSTGWVDTDNDGMLDGFVNGSYDWVDINGGAWATAAAVLIVLVALILAAVLVAMRASQRDRPWDADGVGVPN